MNHSIARSQPSSSKRTSRCRLAAEARRRVLRLEPLEDRAVPSITPLADINRAPISTTVSTVEFNGQAYFNRQTDAGPALWKTDGTVIGTTPVATVAMEKAVAFSGALYFTGTDTAHGFGLWQTDGSPAGTEFVMGLKSPTSLTVAGNYLYFFAGPESSELWRTDGTTDGAVRLRSFFAGGDTYITNLTPVGNQLFFVAGERPVNGNQIIDLWRTDGTVAGTRMIRHNEYGVVGMNGFAYILTHEPTHSINDPFNTLTLWRSDGSLKGTTELAAFDSAGTSAVTMSVANGAVYFTNGSSLWISDGTAAGTRPLVVTLNSNGGYGVPAASSIFAWGSAEYFSADDGTHGIELWRTDGTDVGTYLLKDINPGSASSKPVNFVASGGALYFLADDGTHGQELWRTDGTEIGTVPVLDIEPGATGSAIGSLTPTSGPLFFTAKTTAGGQEVWATDGTGPGTLPVGELEPGTGTSFPASLVAVGPRLVWNANTIADGPALWSSDGSAATPARLSPIPAHTKDANIVPEKSVVFQGNYYFFGDTGVGTALWVTDGTAAGTRLVKDAPGEQAGSVAVLNGMLYFSTFRTYVYPYVDPRHGELWVSDGTAAGTQLLKAYNGASYSNGPIGFSVVSELLYFRLGTVVSNYSHDELWRTDGTVNGTIVLTDTPSSYDYHIGSPYAINGFNGVAYFNGAGGLWQTDGTKAGTVPLPPSGPFPFDEINGTLLFKNGNGQLLASDGTPTGTVLLGQVTVGGQPLRLGGYLYFWGMTDATGLELWRTDGTAAGTTLVKDSIPGPAGWQDPGVWGVVGPFVDAGGVITFTDGLSLWRSDGTDAGTFVLKSVLGKGYAKYDDYISPLTVAADGRIYFIVSTRSRGVEFWTSDGTLAGTMRVKTIFPKLIIPRPGDDIYNGADQLVSVGSAVYFSSRTVNQSDQYEFSYWMSDGTEAGTRQIAKPIYGFPYSRALTDLNGVTLFDFRLPEYGLELGRYDPMSAVPDAYSLEDDLRLDVPAALGVLANDTDGPAGSKRPTGAVLLSLPKNGWLTFHPDGSFTYQPFSRDFSGTDSFTYKATANGDETPATTVTIAVDLANQSPIAADDAAAGRTGRAVKVNVLANDADPDHDSLAIDSYTQGTSGKVRRVGSSLLYTPNSRSVEDDSFTYTVRDLRGATGTATVHVSLTPGAIPRVTSVRLFGGQTAAELVGGDGSFRFRA